MTIAKVGPFCKKHKLHIGVYNINDRRILPRSVTRRDICLYVHNHHFWVIRKTEQKTFSDTLTALQKNFKYEDNQISKDISKQVIEYKFPISYEKNCLFGVFAFVLETLNVSYQIYCEPYAAGVYYLNRLYECYNGDLTEKELEIERQNVHVFDKENGNPVKNMIIYVINNYKDKAKVVAKIYGKKIVSSYKNQMVGHNACGSDNYIVLNFVPKACTNIKMIKTSRVLIKLGPKVGYVYKDDRVIPKDMKFVCSNCHFSGALKNIQKEYSKQPHLLKSEIDQNLITLSTYKKHEKLWKPYLMDDVLGLAYVVAKHGNSVQKITGVSYKNSLTESALAWFCLG